MDSSMIGFNTVCTVLLLRGAHPNVVADLRIAYADEPLLAYTQALSLAAARDEVLEGVNVLAAGGSG